MNDNKDKQKMNFLYVAGFVLAILSMLTAGAAAFVGYYQNKTDLAIIILRYAVIINSRFKRF